ncbi:MAG: TonB-dependent receptor plug domain-containing protein, partial [Hyphomonadaceae bacterium]
MKSWFSKKDRLLAGTIIAGVSALGMAGAAQAQDAEEEIVVTGSRIPQPNLVSVSPVTQVGSEEIANRGVTRIEDMINQLPQAYGAQGSNVSNSASGTATADLRGLGSNRTLVLVNSRRMVAGDPAASTGYSADLNMIPASLVERVEVLTGGASAVYGADAVAGVVNFILQDDFEGARFDAEYSFYQSDNSNDEIGDLAYYESILPQFFRIPDDNVSDGEQYGFSAVFGANTEDGRGNVTVYADYRNINAVLQGERGFSACSFGSGATYSCAGSSTSFPIQVAPATQVANYARGPYIPLPGTRQQVDLDGSLTGSNTYLYNFGASNYYQRPDERYALGGFAHYEINPQIELYAELMFMDDRSIAQIAPSGIFVGSGLGSISGNYVVNCDNPFLTPELVDLICNSDAVPDEYENIGDDTDEDGTTDRDEAIARVIAGGDNPLTPEDESDPVQAAALVDGSLGLQPTCADPTPGGVDDPDTPQNEAANEAICVTQLRVRNVNGGNRQADLRHTQYRIVLGARGELATGWDYDVYGAYNTTIYQQHYLNEYSLSRVNRALINYGGECGVNVDDNPANNDPACVPLDVFDQFGPDQSQLSYITASGQMQGTTTLSMASGVITGDLGQWGLTSPG